MLKLNLPCGDVAGDGSVIKLGSDSTLYFLHFGKFKYDGKEYLDRWYLQKVGSTICIPISDEILSQAQVTSNSIDISSHLGCHCNPNSDKQIFTSEDKYTLDRTWITVDTLTERDSIPKGLVMNGRIVQVNQAEDNESHYYRYNSSLENWVEIHLDNADTEAKLTELESGVDDLETKISTLEMAVDELRTDVQEILDRLDTSNENASSPKTDDNEV